MTRSALDTLLSDGIVAYHAAFAKHFGGVKAAVLLSQLYYWRDKGSDPSGWIYKTTDEIEEETGLSYREQRTARKKLVEAGVLEEDLRGMPAQLYYRVNTQAIERALNQRSADITKRKNMPLRNGRTCCDDSVDHYKEPETTTETTSSYADCEKTSQSAGERDKTPEKHQQGERGDGELFGDLPPSPAEYLRQRAGQALQNYHAGLRSGWQAWVAEHPIIDRLLKNEVDHRGIKRLGFFLADELHLEPPWASAAQVKQHVHGLKELYAAVGDNHEAVRRAYHKMTEDGLTIADANSLVKTASAMARQDGGVQYDDDQLQTMLEEVEYYRSIGKRYAGMDRHERVLKQRGLLE